MIYIGSDHAGFETKEKLKRYFDSKKISYIDLGPEQYKKDDDYPDYAFKVGKIVSNNKESKGILICGTGAGMVIEQIKSKVLELQKHMMPILQKCLEMTMMLTL